MRPSASSGLRLHRLRSGDARPPWNTDDPVRAELLSPERLEEHARALARSHDEAFRTWRGRGLASRLADNEHVLVHAYRDICTAVEEGAPITPAAEWLIDNFHIVEDQIHEVRTDMPTGYYRQLPKLASGPFAGLPRVFAIAWNFVAHTDSRVDSDLLCRFVRAYQEVKPLTIGELWAVPITLRVVLIENLRRIAERVAASRAARYAADAVADQLIASRESGGASTVARLRRYERHATRDAFLVQLVHRLKEQDFDGAPIGAWLEERLRQRGAPAEAVVRDEHQRQVSTSITVRNIITSMRLLSDIDWTELFERMSLVDEVLAETGGFVDMDFATRNLYRAEVETLSRGSDHSELEVARRAVRACERARAGERVEPRRADPGYYLIGGGRQDFEARLGFRPTRRLRLERLHRRLGMAGYVATGVAAAALVLALPLWGLYQLGAAPVWLALLAVLGAIPATDASVAVINRILTGAFGPSLLPALELKTGVPSRLRTLVAVPAMLTSAREVDELVEALEIHHLASLEGDLHFALVTDWADSPSEQVEGDEALLARAVEGVAELNRRYEPAPGGDRFLLLHRRRVWNEGEGKWIGWERKRGKLHELNRLLRGARDTTFIPLAGRPPTVPPGVRYVITLDADTRLPRDTVRRLIGKIAHPLNQARFDPAEQRVVEGYGILQPRVTASLPPNSEGSIFQRIFSNTRGIDPYAAAVSDIYQDLLGEGSYAGKGIYDVDAFEAALEGRVPENRLLSHDLFEGVFARAGLASDVEVLEEFPARYDVAAIRHHRWSRGDWQLLPWILGWRWMLGTAGEKSPAPPSGRWKMADNLRRTLSPPASVASLLAAWLLAPPLGALIWTGFIAACIATPALTPVFADIVPRREGVPLRSHIRELAADFGQALLQAALLMAFLAHQAWLMTDAILWTGVRLFITRRRLLEWVPAAQIALGRRLDLPSFYHRMAGVLFVGGLAIAVAAAAEEAGRLLPLAFALIWFGSPALARWISLTPSIDRRRWLPEADALALRLVARRTWRFFETFVTARDNMLPPDNFQEDPNPVVAHRTSPTNIGLYLLSTVSAREFGWIGTAEAVDRLEATLSTVGRMPKVNGHLYNWYDTTTLEPLEPQYVSSVDSGNLAGHLIALANSCRDWRGTPLTPARRLAGVEDALVLFQEEAGRLRSGPRPQTVTWRQLDEAQAALAEALRQAEADPSELADRIVDLTKRADILADIARALRGERGEGEGCGDMVAWAEAVHAALVAHGRDLAGPTTHLQQRLSTVEKTARTLALEMRFDFLLDPNRQLLSIGYVAMEGALDPSCYDLLASEARLASFFAIAKGDAPARHWFRLGHAVTRLPGGSALVSWSGSMFEYLMPSLVMRAPPSSLIERTNRMAVRRQIDYGAHLGTPWGISESAYNARDLEFTYQYSNFGVPGLGLKRGLAENAVIAPYATALAAMVEPVAAVRNFARLTEAGARGRYGFYEAVDYTPARLPEGQRMAVVRAYMAHHQGMTIAAVANVLFDGVLRSRFHAEPMVQATELLLQERPPRHVPVTPPWATEGRAAARIHEVDPIGARRQADPYAPTPATHLLSNGRYSVMLTAAGSGYSRWGELAITRWREDPTRDDWGAYIYLRDLNTGAAWSAGLQPLGVAGQAYAAVFAEDRAEITRRDGAVTTTLEVLVSEEDDAEVRRVTLTNSGSTPAEIEVTSYAELVLAPSSADAAHPAFSKLFVQTEHLAGVGALLATRRRREPSEPEVWAAHLAVVEGDQIGPPEFETDRARFLGRGGEPRSATAILAGDPLSGATGSVLDPIFALRRRVRIAPGATVHIAFWTMAASTRRAVLDLIDKHKDPAAFERAATLAWTQALVELQHLGVSRAESSLFQRLAGHVLYAGPALRGGGEGVSTSAAQSELWPLGISGDLPIVLLRIADIEHLDTARQLLRAFEYWRMKQLPVDLVILNERTASYIQDLQTALENLVWGGRPQAPAARGPSDGQVFVVRADLAPEESIAALGAAARVSISAQRGRIADQLDWLAEAAPPPRPPRVAPAGRTPSSGQPEPALEFYNGLGGFGDDGREYVTILDPGQSTPAPWINVVSNPDFGFQVSAAGAGYTWSVSSRERQLTPWSNDPTTEAAGEVIYLRDEDTGELWTPTALPIRHPAATYVARHGWGYSRFEHASHGLEVELVQYVPTSDPVKISRLTIRNRSGRRRRLSATAYAEWVLGPSRQASAPFAATDLDPQTGALLARNRWNGAFAGRTAFLDLGGAQTSWTGDRREFIGRNGSLAAPAGLIRAGPLSGRTGARLDPCGALQTSFELAPGAVHEVVILLGDGADAEAARGLVDRYRAADLDAVLSEVAGSWDELLGTLKVRTPDRATDLMLNGWLLYQATACRMWARSGFYQASGAYGFRDQLQDAMALAAIRPELTREQLLRAAARQFEEGDVQHWWLPHSGEGVRTRMTDDRVWLAYATDHYLTVTDDQAVLDESVPFLTGPALESGEAERFFRPETGAAASLYEHCARALDRSLEFGGHGAPLIGTGDWNDGMNRVGERGQGESVWLGWLLYASLAAFSPRAEARGDHGRAAAWRAHTAALKASLERHAWDGQWYKRGWYDDGSPLGSAASDECRIDSIAQSWAVLSGAARPERAARAMAAVERELVVADAGLALLFKPPFDRTPLDPGYIKGYPPGVRENGGQYTHAATWSVLAFAALGEGDKAADLFAMLNPINHARSRADAYRYKVEPYVVAADVYSVEPHRGRGGWTWYTGSAAWLQRAGVEGLLGLRRRGAFLEIDPCIPKAWPGFEVELRFGRALYRIRVENGGGAGRGVSKVELDGAQVQGARIPLADDGIVHDVLVEMG